MTTCFNLFYVKFVSLRVWTDFHDRGEVRTVFVDFTVEKGKKINQQWPESEMSRLYKLILEKKNG